MSAPLRQVKGMKLLAMLVSLAAVLGLQAQTPPKLIAGVVTAVDAFGKQIKVTGDDGVSYSLALQDNTIYQRMPLGETDQKKATRIALSDVTVGDRLIARGPVAEDKTVPVRTVLIMSKSDVAQKQQRDQADWQKRGVTGIASAVNVDAKEVIISTRGRDSKTVTVDVSSAVFRRYAPDSLKFADAKPSSLADVQPGDTLRVLGDRSDEGARLKAQEIVSGAFETIAATVISTDPASGEVKLTNLATKKPVVVRTNSSTTLRRIDEQTATMLARRMRPATPGDAPPQQGAAPQPPTGRGPDSATGGRGFGGGRGPGGSGDLQQVLDRSPQLALAELKKGDAVILSGTKVPDGAPITAFSFVAGVEPFLAAAPRTAGQVNLGSWSLEVGGPGEQ
jgi:hypothetical protein